MTPTPLLCSRSELVHTLILPFRGCETSSTLLRPEVTCQHPGTMLMVADPWHARPAPGHGPPRTEAGAAHRGPSAGCQRRKASNGTAPSRRRSGAITSCAQGSDGAPDLLYIDLHLCTRSPAPGLRGAASGRAQVRRPDLSSPPRTTTPPPWTSTCRSRMSPAGTQIETLRPTAGLRGAPALPGGRRPGHRPRRRPAAGADAAGHDRGLRRLPHLHPRGLRGAGLRHRYHPGRALLATQTLPIAPFSTMSVLSRASCPRAAAPRTSSWPSSPRSVPMAPRGTSSSTGAGP